MALLTGRLQGTTAPAVASAAVVLLLAIASAAGLLLGTRGLYGSPAGALGPTASTAGILVPGFLGHDVFNLLVGVPVLGGAVWLARRGRLVWLLLWPGALFYVLYTCAVYLIGAPFSGLFLLYAALVAVSAFTKLLLLAGIERDAVRARLESSVLARAVGGLLVGLALVTTAQDATGGIRTALGGGLAVEPPLTYLVRSGASHSGVPTKLTPLR